MQQDDINNNLCQADVTEIPNNNVSYQWKSALDSKHRLVLQYVQLLYKELMDLPLEQTEVIQDLTHTCATLLFV